VWIIIGEKFETYVFFVKLSILQEFLLDSLWELSLLSSIICYYKLRVTCERIFEFSLLKKKWEGIIMSNLCTCVVIKFFY